MKKSYLKLMVFCTIIVTILLLNSLILSILSNYYYMAMFLAILVVIFKFAFGFEKDNHRYIKDIILELAILYLASFIIFYLSGLIIGFARTSNYYSWYGLKTFIIPYVLVICLKEFLRYQMLNKVEKHTLYTIAICMIFVFIDIGANIANKNLIGAYNIFIYFALTVLPAISDNVAATYVAKKVGYKPNIFWLLIANLYAVLLPIIPNTGLYVSSIIKFLFPFVIIYNVYVFFRRRERNVPLRTKDKNRYIGLVSLAIVTVILVYFVSGFFKYYAIAIGSGSMTPTIYKGDVVIVDQEFQFGDLDIGDIIAYRYNGVVVVHRLVNIVIIDDEYYFYTKGDANLEKDNYVIFSNTVVGVVKARVPFIGAPTVWLSEL